MRPVVSRCARRAPTVSLALARARLRIALFARGTRLARCHRCAHVSPASSTSTSPSTSTHASQRASLSEPSLMLASLEKSTCATELGALGALATYEECDD